jgi:hypothetical protein
MTRAALPEKSERAEEPETDPNREARFGASAARLLPHEVKTRSRRSSHAHDGYRPHAGKRHPKLLPVKITDVVFPRRDD